ncbi:MAG: hypothetical protein ABJL54_16000 [Halioglobus sp.]
MAERANRVTLCASVRARVRSAAGGAANVRFHLKKDTFSWLN